MCLRYVFKRSVLLSWPVIFIFFSTGFSFLLAEDTFALLCWEEEKTKIDYAFFSASNNPILDSLPVVAIPLFQNFPVAAIPLLPLKTC